MGPAYLAHVLRSSFSAERLSDLLKENEQKKSKEEKVQIEYNAVPVFRHALLDPYWAPQFYYQRKEQVKYDLAKEEFPGLRDLIKRPEARNARQLDTRSELDRRQYT